MYYLNYSGRTEQATLGLCSLIRIFSVSRVVAAVESTEQTASAIAVSSGLFMVVARYSFGVNKNSAGSNLLIFLKCGNGVEHGKSFITSGPSLFKMKLLAQMFIIQESSDYIEL